MTLMKNVVQSPLFAKQKKKLTKPQIAQILPAYEIVESTMYLYTFGVHENFYRSLKQYRSSTG
jgi:hypothetical protein